MKRAVCWFAFVFVVLTPAAWADTAADVAEVERQIQLRKVAEEVRARAWQRTKDAIEGSSLGETLRNTKEPNRVAEKNLLNDLDWITRKLRNTPKGPARQAVEVEVRALEEKAERHMKALQERLAALVEYESLYQKLYRKFLREEVEAAASHMTRPEIGKKSLLKLIHRQAI